MTVDAQQNVITLIAMVVVAVAFALVVDRASRRADASFEARTEAALLACYRGRAPALRHGFFTLRRLT
ncbi:hypothetical protein [Amycolatopsis sp. CA-126428]|uniref:hypothetical protein n=1 Tax=Amycolatopsis sp. CA-126428 TaxID=2073158 RepID=UPI000CD245BD